MKKLFGMKKIRLILIFIVIIVVLGFYFAGSRNTSNVSTSTAGWQTYTSTEGNFRILFPQGDVKISTSDVKLEDNQARHEINYNISDSDGNLYLVQASIGSIILDPSLSALNTVKEQLKKQKSDWTVISENISEFKEFQAYNLVLKRLKQREEYMRYRGFSIYNYDYLIGMYSTTNSDFPQFEKFASSFELIDAGPRDIKSLQDYINKAQTLRDYWKSTYATGKYSKQDLDKIIDLSSKIISSCQTILSNLQSGNINNNSNISLWRQVTSMTVDLEAITNRLLNK